MYFLFKLITCNWLNKIKTNLPSDKFYLDKTCFLLLYSYFLSTCLFSFLIYNIAQQLWIKLRLMKPKLNFVR